MAEHLLLISIGPVQEFIASARRSRDLWFGSWLLSELAKTAARTLVAEEGIERLVFPAPARSEDLADGSALNVAKKIVVRVSGAPLELAQAAERAVRARLAELADDAFGRVSGVLLRDQARAQVAELLEWYWVALPLAGERPYADVRAQLEALGAARKLTRDVGPVVFADSLPKSSIDGQRESVIPETQFDMLSAEQIYRQYGARAAERLSGVDLLKRHGQGGGEARFPSTSHMAAVPLLNQISQADLGRARVAWDDYRTALSLAGVELDRLPERLPRHPVLGPFEGSLLFEERLVEEATVQNRLPDAQRALRDVLAVAAGGVAPYPYFAILHADGDRMGTVIDAQKDAAGHRRLSAALDAFAHSVRGVVEQDHQGALVYAGGDDVLALLPLHTAIPCAAKLAANFQQALQSYTDREGKPPSLSAGIVFTHHLEPLSDALEEARKAERHAKSLDGKNALAVTVCKRSGADTTVCDHWEHLDKRLLAFANLYRIDAVPDGAAFELRSLAFRLAVPSIHPDAERLARAQRAEAGRILARKQAEHGQTSLDLTHATLHVLSEALNDLTLPIGQIADELVVAREIARGLDQAGIGA